MTTQDFILEIGSEEIPAGYISPALEQIKNYTDKWFTENQIKYEALQTLATPRRLTLFMSKVSTKQEVSEKLFMGPPARIAYDAEGNLTKAGLGFAKTQNVDPGQLFKQNTDKGDYLAVNKTIGGQPTKDLLSQFCKDLISSITFPKAMFWEPTQFRYARPIRWVLSLYGQDVIPLEIADVHSDNYTYGHSIRDSKKIQFTSANINDYKENLRKAFVIVDPNERKSVILQKLNEFGTIDKDPDLLEVVTYLVESPSLIKGNFLEEHLQLPSEVLITSMKHHQKYFPMIGTDGKLQAYFLSVHNSASTAEPNIKTGNERVLQARLSDAQFFWKEDTKTPLQDKNKKLTGLLFQAKLGNYDKKTERISLLSQSLAKRLGFNDEITTKAKRTAELCKVDLVTEMVKEFPELQGVMGRLYALKDGENPEVAQAIQDHYLPKGSDSELPKNNIGAVVSIADKLDSIVGCFGVGLIPTGSEDPLALRRAGNGIIKLVLSNPDWSFSLKQLINDSAESYQSTVNIDTQKGLTQVSDFLAQRLRGSLIESGIRYDTADAILSAFFDDINDTVRRAKALQEMRKMEEFVPLTVAFKRVINILKQAREKFKQESFGSPDPSKFVDEAEKTLHQEIGKVTESISKAVSQKRYIDSLQMISKLRPPVDLFFDKVMVMAEDAAVRTNRLALLEQLESQFRQLADFTQLVVEEQ